MCTSCVSVMLSNDINAVMEWMDKVEDAACYQRCDNWLGNLVVDITPQEEEAFALSAARENGLPEPELYVDESPALYEESEEERVLTLVIELQERMAKGMSLIQEANGKLSSVRGRIQHAHSHQSNRIPYSEYCMLMESRTKWTEHLSKLWKHWHSLKAECDTLINGNNKVWGQYFGLVDEVISPYLTNGNTEMVDDQVNLHQSASQLAEELAVSHLQEMSSLSE